MGTSYNTNFCNKVSQTKTAACNYAKEDTVVGKNLVIQLEIMD